MLYWERGIVIKISGLRYKILKRPLVGKVEKWPKPPNFVDDGQNRFD